MEKYVLCEYIGFLQKKKQEKILKAVSDDRPLKNTLWMHKAL